MEDATAEQEACRIEHDISEQSFQKLKRWKELGHSEETMVIEFPEERLPEICSFKRKLQALEGVKIYMEPQQIRYPGFSWICSSVRLWWRKRGAVDCQRI